MRERVLNNVDDSGKDTMWSQVRLTVGSDGWLGIWEAAGRPISQESPVGI